MLVGLGGLPKDEREAVRLYKLSADQGNAQGQVNLGSAYSHELGGLPKDEREAVRLYKLSADQGNARGSSKSRVCLQPRTQGVPKTSAKPSVCISSRPIEGTR